MSSPTAPVAAAPVPVLGRTVEAVMRPAVTTVEPRAHLAAAAYLIKRSHDTALVVTTPDGRGVPLGVVTDADITEAVAQGRDLEAVRIGEVFTRPPVTVPPDTAILDAVRLMLAEEVHHLLVVDGDQLLGIVDMVGVCRALATPEFLLPSARPAS
jgi:CBS domain-containing protein